MFQKATTSGKGTVRFHWLFVFNHSFRSTFEVDNRDPKNPKIRLELMSDGELAYV